MPGMVTCSLSISGGMWTRTQTVGLIVSASSTAGPVTQMRFSNDGTTFSPLETFMATKMWPLSIGDGPKTVTAEVRDGTGSTCRASAGITLDATPPQVTSLVINMGALETNQLLLSMGTTVTDGTGSGVTTIEFSEDLSTWSAPQTWSATLGYMATASTGQRRFYARARDVAGNVTLAPYASDDLMIDISSPVVTMGSVSPSPTRLVDVTLTLSAFDTGTGLASMCVKSGTLPVTFSAPSPTDTCWRMYTASGPVMLAATADGNQRVFVWLRDRIGNSNPFPYTVDVFLDRVAPNAPTLTLISVTQQRTIRFAYTAGTDPAPAAAPLTQWFGFRLAGSGSAFITFTPRASGTPGQYLLDLSAANTWELATHMIDGAGNVSPDAVILPTTYFAWTPEYRLPWAIPNGPSASAVVNGRFVMGAQSGGTWIDNADGFATRRRVDASSGYGIAPVPGTSRALLNGSFVVSYTNDYGVTNWTIPAPSLSSVWYGAAFAGTTTMGGSTIDSFVRVGSNGYIVRADITNPPGGIPSGSFVQVTSGTTNTLVSVAACSGMPGVLVAAGENTTVRRSGDGGRTWSSASLPAGTSAALRDVVAVPGGSQVMFMTGSNPSGLLLRSMNCGASWSAVSGAGSSNLMAMTASGDATGYTLGLASGAFAPVSLRRYNGTTFSSVPLPVLSPPISRATTMAAMGTGASTQVIYGGADGDVIHLSQDGAVVARRSEGSTSIRAVAFNTGSTEKLIMVGGGSALVSQNHGVSWTEEATGGNGLQGVYGFSDDTAVVVGFAPTNLVARSAAGAWTPISGAGPASLLHVSCMDLAGCLITGYDKTVVRYDPVTRAVSVLLAPVAGAGPYHAAVLWRDTAGTTHGVVVGDNGVFRTCTGCLTGSSFSVEGQVPPYSGTTYPYLHGVAARPNGRVIAVGDGTFAVSYASNDFGVTWARTPDDPSSFGDNVVVNAANTSTWYSGGDRGVSVSVDDGATWGDITPASVSFYGLTTPSVPGFVGRMVAAGSYGAVHYTTTGGR